MLTSRTKEAVASTLAPLHGLIEENRNLLDRLDWYRLTAFAGDSLVGFAQGAPKHDRQDDKAWARH